LSFLKSDFYLELLHSCVLFSYARVESRAIDPSFDLEDAEDPEYAVPDNEYSNSSEGVMSFPTM
jgi:hypothetical protein